jgi:hypothetical protein
MFELHVVVAGIVMVNILELIMEIVPNYPTVVRTTAVAEAWGGVAEARGGASASCAGGVVAAGARHLNYGEGSLV